MLQTTLTAEYAAKIDEYVDTLSTLVAGASEIIVVNHNDSPYNNLRDALHHYEQLCLAEDESRCKQQGQCIDEHLTRGMKDALLYYAYYAGLKLSFHIGNRAGSNKQQRKQLRETFHGFRNFILMARSQPDRSTIDLVEEFNDILAQLIAVLKVLHLHSQFKANRDAPAIGEQHRRNTNIYTYPPQPASAPETP